MTIEPSNLTAQLHHRAAGNPPSTLPDAAISNCFPGLEFDFRNLWRRIFEGIDLHEASGLVVGAPSPLQRLEGRYLIEVAGASMLAPVHGPTDGEADAQLRSSFLEWSNALADVLATSTGQRVPCVFFDTADNTQETVALKVREVFARSAAGERLAVIDEELVQPGDLTQSLCSPWQNDYRECGCYYWAASRPDYVNRELTADGTSVGNNWMSRSRDPKVYEADSAANPRQLNYDDLFRNWQGLLRFVVGGRDHD